MRIPSISFLRWVLTPGGDIYNVNAGNVTIGSDTPTGAFKLEVKGHVGPYDDNTWNFGSAAKRIAGLWLGPSSLHLVTTVAETGFDTDWTFGVVTGIGQGALKIAESGNTRVTVLPSGNVGIGITAPTEPLHVIGRAIVTDTPLIGTHVVNKNYLDLFVQGLDWQDSVLSQALSTPPGLPAAGDRYIVGPAPTGAWVGHAEKIARWNGTLWEFFQPNEGWAAWIEDEDVLYVYNSAYPGGSWVKFGTTITHANLIGLSADDHPHYLLADASRLVSGHLRPDIDDTRDLGTSVLRWRDLYLGPTSLHVVASALEAGVFRDYRWSIQETVGPDRGNLRLVEGLNELLAVTPSGKLGLNRTTPAAWLDISADVEGEATIELRSGVDTFLRVSPVFTGGRYRTSFDSINERDIIFPLYSAARFGIGTASPAYYLDVAGEIATTGGANVARLFNPSGTLSVLSGATHLELHAGGLSRIHVESDGRVGVGTTSPGAGFILHVVGDQRLNGGLSVDTVGSVPFITSIRDIVNAGGQFRTQTGSTLNLQTDGSSTTRLHIALDGKVGIGNTIPGQALDVTGQGRFSKRVVIGYDDDPLLIVDSLSVAPTTAPTLYLRDTQAVKTLNVSVRLEGASSEVRMENLTNTFIAQSISGKYHIKDDTAGLERLTIDSTGKVGIGVTAPTANLELATGQISTPAGSVTNPSYSFTGTLSTGMYSHSPNHISFATLGGLRWYVSSGGHWFGTGGSIYTTAGSAASPIYSFVTDTNTGIFSADADALGFSTGGVERLRLDSAGTLIQSSPSGGLVNYNTADQTTNYERAVAKWTSSIFTISTERGGTGSQRIIDIVNAFSSGLRLNDGTLNLIGSSSGVHTIAPNDLSITLALRGTLSASGTTATRLGSTGSLAATSGIQTFTEISGTIAQGGTAGYTGLFIDITESSVGSGSKLLANFRVGGSTKFSIDNAGNVFAAGSLSTSGSLIPIADDTYDLGSSSFRWRDLYLGPTSLRIESTVAETVTARSYRFAIEEATGAFEGALRINEGATKLLSINTTGNVSIGPTDPTAAHRLMIDGAVGSPTFGSSFVNVSLGTVKLSGNNDVILETALETDAFVLKQSGTIGINATSTPDTGTRLHLKRDPGQAALLIEVNGSEDNVGWFLNANGGTGAEQLIRATNLLAVGAGQVALGYSATTDFTINSSSVRVRVAGSSAQIPLALWGNVAAQTVPYFAITSGVLANTTADIFVVGSTGQLTGITGSAAIPTYSFISDPDTGIYAGGTNALNFATGGSARWGIDGSSILAAIDSGSRLQTGFGTAALPGYAFNGDADTGIYRAAADTLGFVVGTTEQMRLTSAGSLAVGGTSASTRLHVYGNVTADDPTAATHLATKNYVDGLINGLDWQESVKDKDLTTPPGSPVTGDRYIVASVATGAWAGQEEKIAQWNGTAWIFITPDKGTAVLVEDESLQYTYNDTHPAGSWVLFGSLVDHGSLVGLLDDDHTQYLLVNGTRGMTGNLVPDLDIGVSLGTTLKRWSSLYVGPSSLHVYSLASETTTARDWTFAIQTSVGSTQGNLRFMEGASEHATLSTAGSFGIGAIDPQRTLHVKGAASRIRLENTSGVTGEFFTTSTSIGLGSTTIDQFLIDNTAPASALRLSNDNLIVGLSSGIVAAAATNLLIKSDTSGTVGNSVILQGYNGTAWQNVISLPNKASGNVDLKLVENGGNVALAANSDTLTLTLNWASSATFGIERQGGSTGSSAIRDGASTYNGLGITDGLGSTTLRGVWVNQVLISTNFGSAQSLQLNGSEGVVTRSANGFFWTGGADTSGARDTALIRNAAAVVAVSNGTTAGLTLAQSGVLSYASNNQALAIRGTYTTTSGAAAVALGNTPVSGSSFSASSGDQTIVSIAGTFNQTSTAGYTGLLIDITETTTGSGTKNLANWKVGGATKFSVDRLGNIFATGGISLSGSIIPGTDDFYDLGSSSFRWKDLYLGPTSLHIESTAAETTTARAYKFAIEEASGSFQGALRINEGATKLLSINTTGNVAIGSADPATTHRLSVDGTIGGPTFANSYLDFAGNVTLSANNAVIIGKVTPANAVVVHDDGRLGIQQINPTHSLTLPSISTGVALYNTADQATNYERLVMSWTSNRLDITTQFGGTGVNRGLRIQTASAGSGIDFGASDGGINIIGNAASYTNINTFSDNVGLRFRSRINASTAASVVDIVNDGFGTKFSAASGLQTVLSLGSDVNQTGTAGYSGLTVNMTEVTTGSGNKKLTDLKVGGASKYVIDNDGTLHLGGDIGAAVRLQRGGSSIFRIVSEDASTNFFQVQLSGMQVLHLGGSSGYTAASGWFAASNSHQAWLFQQADAVQAARVIGSADATGEIAAVIGTKYTDAASGNLATLLRLATDADNTTLASTVAKHEFYGDGGYTSFAASAASSGSFTSQKIGLTLTQTGTAGYTGLLVDVTETSTGSGTKRLLDLKVGGTTQFSVSNTGTTAAAGTMSAVAYTGPSGLVFIQNPLVFSSVEQDPILTPNYTFDQWGIFVGTPVGTQVVLGPSSSYTKDFDHPNQVSPTLFIHSSTDPDTDNTEWLSAYHTATHGRIDTGKGDLLVTPFSGKLRLSDAAATNQFILSTTSNNDLTIRNAADSAYGGIHWGGVFTDEQNTSLRIITATKTLNLSSDFSILWGITASYSATKDLGLIRNAVSELKVTDGSTGTGSFLANIGSFSNLRNALGAEATPSYTFTGDLDTGMWSPGANILTLSTQALEALRINPSQQVLIGTSTVVSGARLTINGTVSASTPTANEHLATKAYVDGAFTSLDWQESVKDRDLYIPPGSPTTGDRYIIGNANKAITAVDTTNDWFKVSGDITAELIIGNTFVVVGSTGNNGTYTVQAITFSAGETQIDVDQDITNATADGFVQYASGAWNNQTEKITQYTGAAWSFITPDEGTTTYVEDENINYVYSDAYPTGTWAQFSGGVSDHGALTGLLDDDHPQYLLVDGTRGMTGNLVPDTDLGASLGTTLKRWSNVYAGPASLHVYSTAAETTTARDYNFKIETTAGPTQGNMFLREGTTNRLSVSAAGNVGIGTDNATTLFHVVGFSRLESLQAGDGGAQLTINAGSVPVTITAKTASDVGAIIRGQPVQTADILRVTDSALTARYLVVDSGGNLGLGKAVPTSRVHIKASTTGVTGGLILEANGTSSNLAELLEVTANEGELILRSSGAANVLLRAGAASQSFIEGPVAIGATGSTAKFYVDGNVAVGSGYGGSTPQTDGLRVQGRVDVGTTVSAPTRLTVFSPTASDTLALAVQHQNAGATAQSNYNFSGAGVTSTYTTSFLMTDTGLFIGHNSGARTLVLQTASTDRLTIGGTGLVGIATAPTATFLVTTAGPIGPSLNATYTLGTQTVAWSQIHFSSFIEANTSGSAASPSYQWGSASNYGMYFTGTGIGFSTAGTLRLAIITTQITPSLSIIPDVTNSRALGSTAVLYSGAFATAFHASASTAASPGFRQVSTTTGMHTTSTSIGFAVTGTSYLDLTTTNLTAGVNVIPGTNNTRDLGTSSVGWKDAYLTGGLVVGFNGAAVADKIQLGDANLNLDASTITTPKLWFDEAAGDYIGYDRTANQLTFGIGNAGYLLLDSTNLTANVHVIPGTDDTHDLGTASLRWRDLYLGPASLHVVSTAGETTTAREYKLNIQETAGVSQGNLRFMEGATEHMTLSTAGRLGLGVPNPLHKLHMGASESFAVGMSAPTSATTQLGAAGTPNGTFYYVVTALDQSGGETIASNEATASPVSQEVFVRWHSVAGAYQYRVYKGTVSGTYTEYFILAAPTLQYTDAGASGTAGSPPSTTTAMSVKIGAGQTFMPTSDGPMTVKMSPPTNPSATATTGGTLTDGTYYYKITAIDGAPYGETLPTTEVSAVIVNPTTNAVNVAWTSAPGASGYLIYKGTSSGNQNEYFVTYGNATSFLDTGSTGTAGTVPTVGTAYIAKFSPDSNSWWRPDQVIGNFLGIGTATPAYMLHIYNDRQTDGDTKVVIRAGMGQSGPMFDVQDNISGGTLFNVGASSIGIALSTMQFTSNSAEIQDTSTGGGLTIRAKGGTSANPGILITPTSNFTHTSGTLRLVQMFNTFAPSSGTATYATLRVAPTINQTGGANGITRGIYIEPTITAMGSGGFRAIDISNNTSLSYGIYQSGALARNYFAGVVSINQTNSTVKLGVGADSSATPMQIYSAGSTASSEFIFYRGNGTLASLTNIVSGDVMGSLVFAGNISGSIYRGASIHAAVDQTPGASDMPGRLVFSTSPDGSATVAERMRIDRNGNIGIGTSSVSGGADSTLHTVFTGTGNGVAAFDTYSSSLETAVRFGRARNTTASPLIVNSGDTIADLAFKGWDGSAFQYAASIRAVVDGTPGAGDMPGSLIFLTTPAADIVPATRMRIDKAGQVNIGTATTTQTAGTVPSKLFIQREVGQWGLTIEGQGTNQSDLIFRTPNNTADYELIQFVNSADKFMFRRLTDAGAVGSTIMTFDLLKGNEVGFGTSTVAYPTPPEAGNNTIVMYGSTADYRFAVQDGNGRVNHYWNAYDDAGLKFQITGDYAVRYRMDGSAGGHVFYVSDVAGTAGAAITWRDVFSIDLSGYLWLIEQASSPATPTSGYANLYQKTDGNLFHKNDVGDEQNLTKGSMFSCSYSGGSYAGGVVRYYAIDGIPLAVTVEAETQIRLRGPGRIGRLRIYLSANTISTGSTNFNLRINGATVLTIVVPASSTGAFTNNSMVSYAHDDLVDWQVDSGAATGTASIRVMQMDCV